MKKINTKPCRFYIVRHGETEWNTKKIMQGHLDSPLTENGINQAANLANELKEIKFAKVISSDLMRAYRTAELIAADREIAITSTELLREVNIGPFTGKKLDYFLGKLKKQLEYRDKLDALEKLTYRVHPKVESFNQAAERAFRVMRAEALANLGKNILVVTHAGVITAMLLKLGVNVHLKKAVANTGYVVLESDGVEFFLKETKGINLA